ncbi:MAG TPA: hypothetical protein VH114_15015 [Candidatus Acidoferrum sp.]|jgi:uncharacterized phage infection (PIP) family protein YhgE|nr:hypothetical protein [Candidatus Acidoferrum sp.]
MAFVGAAGVLAAEPLLAALQSPGTSPKAKPYPNGRDPNVPPEVDEPRVLDQRALELQNQKKLRSDVARLYEMASDLKEQVEKTDASATFSVSLVKKAQQIEKLAKQIKDLAKG